MFFDRVTVFLFCFLLLFYISSKAQNTDDFTLIKSHLKTLENEREQANIRFQRSLNPFKAISFITLFFYQKIISEQISAECEFDMSCSNFGIRSLQEFGIIKAIGITADRLTRCNGQAQSETENYLINHSTGKVIDEPSMYRFKN
jgi:putative component of membrane protein insertase Oxa1/YidC/SpoIIIJ protein YidD